MRTVEWMGPSVMPSDSQERKDTPLAEGVLDYFPNALAAVARVSKAGNDKHNPGEPLHWSRGKSSDHANTIIRHLADRGLDDEDGLPHSAHLAWRALALLEEELEAAGANPGRGSVFPPTRTVESVRDALLSDEEFWDLGLRKEVRKQPLPETIDEFLDMADGIAERAAFTRDGRIRTAIRGMR